MSSTFDGIEMYEWNTQEEEIALGDCDLFFFFHEFSTVRVTVQVVLAHIAVQVRMKV